MNDVYKDLDYACDVVNKHVSNKYYDKIYFQSNEMLDQLFSNFSVEGKDVLSVLASSDQMFHCYQRGAKNVDTFDINKLTYYYYYLRKWGILYFDTYYPFFEDLGCSNKYIFDCLKKASSFSEEDHDAFLFWNEYCDRTWGYQNKELFIISQYGDENEIRDLSLLRDIVSSKKLSFKNLDISNKMDVDKKYDVIILSNIMEYLALNDVDFSIIENNLYNLLKDDGVIVCSHLMHRAAFERDKLKNKFDYFEYPYSYRKTFVGELRAPVGYSYKKKK